VLANPAGMEQYNGLKHSDDKSDAFFIAEMLRLKILPTGYICDRELRPVRDLLRRRMGLVQKRTSLMLSLKSLHTRMKGEDLPLNQLKVLEPSQAVVPQFFSFIELFSTARLLFRSCIQTCHFFSQPSHRIFGKCWNDWFNPATRQG
jgi:hypothetical protein